MKRGRDHLDPITFELIHANLLSAAEEMGALLKRSSFSPIIREMDDFSCALFEAGGDLVAQADYIPAQLGAMSLVVKATLERWRGSIRPGDVFIANHPYLGCMHTPDINILVPVFVEQRLFAWTGSTAHHIDVGGVNPGTEGADLRQLYAEGLVLPPVHLARAGVEDLDLVAIITSNVRDPSSTVADLRAQRAACELGRRRILEAVERYGAGRVGATFRRALDHVERATRAALADLPDGEGEAEGFLDDDGVGGPPTRIHVRLRKEGDRLEVDLSGSAPQVPGALNVPWASTRAAVVFLVRAMTDPALPTNDGVLRPVRIVCPKGNVLNPEPPAAVSVRHNTCQRLADTLVRAAGNLWPDRAVASGCVAFFDVNLESVSPRTGRTSVMMDVVGGGTGGHRRGDGLDGVDTYLSNVALLPTEVAEAEYAVRIVRTELVPGSQGRGEHHGGLGLRREYLILDRPQVATVYAEQTDPRFPPAGVRGGMAGAPTRLEILDPEGRRLAVPTKVTLTLQPGSVIRVETSGGGGYGDPRRRDPAAARADREDGRVPAGGRRRRADGGPGEGRRSRRRVTG
ncbi:MAG TPA: hydantoinase B/oxoprolinase family protein [Actinomycetota bacterium]|nr:hydantoinase B/oxoprolinase family protein [Actinomycetota bacterium]